MLGLEEALFIIHVMSVYCIDVIVLYLKLELWTIEITNNIFKLCSIGITHSIYLARHPPTNHLDCYRAILKDHMQMFSDQLK